jgi:4-amino-4-deoxy-L-arabinose transferase-like glycosyltransferase
VIFCQNIKSPVIQNSRANALNWRNVSMNIMRRIGEWCAAISPDPSPAISIAATGTAILCIFLTAPTDLNYWWSDAGSHALNGALIHDFIASGNFTNAYAFAVDYYSRYPALTLGIYPPFFPVVEAAVFAVTGFSQFAAQLTVSLFSVLLAFFLYQLMRTAAPSLLAATAVLVLFSMPGVLLWSRQVMLEIPTCALLTGSAYFLIRYLRDSRISQLIFAILSFAAAVYTKQTAGFAIVPFTIAIIWFRGFTVLRERNFWIAAALAIILIMPLALFTVVVASHNINVATSGVGEERMLGSETLFWYAVNLPEVTGILPIVAALGYLVTSAVRGWGSPRERLICGLMILWFIGDYVFISVIAHREERYALFLTVPVAILAVFFLARLLPERLALPVALLLAVAAFAAAIVTQPVPRIDGYKQVAQFVVQELPKGGVVLFHGHRSANFVLALREIGSDDPIRVLRAEKYLVNYQPGTSLILSDRNASTADIDRLIDRYGIEYVVLQPNFWDNQPSVKNFHDIVYSSRFTKVAEFPIIGNTFHNDKSILIFRNNHPVSPSDKNIVLELPILKGRKIEGQIR